MANADELTARLRTRLAGRDDVTEKRMFGGQCFMVRGHMLGGVAAGRYVFRIGKDLQARALSRRGASPMDFTGRPLAGFVYVSPESCDANELEDWELDDWIDLAMQFNRSLPDR